MLVGENMIWIWLGVVISLLLIESMSRNLTAICFAISGIVSCIMTKYQEKYNIQLIAFLVIGIFLILVIRPFLLNRIKEKSKVAQISPKITIICFFISGFVTILLAPMKDMYRIILAILLVATIVISWMVRTFFNRPKEKKKEKPSKDVSKEKIEEKPVLKPSKGEVKKTSKKKKKKKKK